MRVLRRTVYTIAVAVLLAIGLWQLGHGIAINTKATLAQYLLRRAWGRTLAGEPRAKPWPWADTWPVARMRVPSHGVDLIVLAGATGSALAFGPGLVSGTTVPGAPGVAVVTGHRDTHFRFLQHLKSGDEIVVETMEGHVARFVVDEAFVIDARTAVIGTGAGAARLVLLTCYPFDALRPGGPLRYAVVSVPGTSGGASRRTP